MSYSGKILVSACLLGEQVRYDGGDAQIGDAYLKRWQTEGRLVSFCPECAAGLPIPRAPAEISEGRVKTQAGEDLTGIFEAGARKALALCQAQGIKLAILKENSPTCGSSFIYDGTFSGARTEGEGVAAALLREEGITVFSECETDQALCWMEDQIA